jgi:lysophospholipase L1-like esterase
MADAPKLQATDSLRTAYPKINQAIDNANKAITDSSIAKTDSSQAKSTAESVQTQLDNIVIEGDSSVEAAQARVDSEGMTYSTLKERIDEEQKKIKNFEQETIAKIAQDMANGLTVEIDCRGDSLYYGHEAPDGTQTSIPAPAMLQSILRSYYENSNIIVTNNGVKGDQTTNALRNWETNMAASNAQVVYICYGINDANGGNPTGITDPAINAEQFRKNLRRMVKTAREKGKIVVLENPNIVVQGGTYGTLAKSEKVRQFASAMKQVANELNVILIDSHQLSEKHISKGVLVKGIIADGYHPTASFYKIKGSWMATPFIKKDVITVDGDSVVIPATSPGVRGGGNAVDTPASLVGEGKLGTSIKIPIFVEKNGLDVYVAMPVWSGGSTSCDIKVNTELVKNTSVNDPNLTTNFAIDKEFMVLENAAVGFYLIELNSNTAPQQVGFYYLKTYNTRKKTTLFGGGTTGQSRRSLVLSDFSFGSDGGESHILTDIPTSNLIKSLDVEVVANFSKNQGFMLFGHKIGKETGLSPRGGLTFFLNSSTGYLLVAEGTMTGYTTPVTIHAADISGVTKRYRVNISSSGVATIYVDNQQVNTYTMAKPNYGGFLGFYKSTAGTNIIDRVLIN